MVFDRPGQGTGDFATGGIALGMEDTTGGVTALAPQGHAAPVVEVKRAAMTPQAGDGPGSIGQQVADHRFIAQAHTGGQGIRHVEIDGVIGLGLMGFQHGGDATLSPGGIALAGTTLDQQQHLTPGVSGL